VVPPAALAPPPVPALLVFCMPPAPLLVAVGWGAEGAEAQAFDAMSQASAPALSNVELANPQCLAELRRTAPRLFMASRG
jgi:hypothetical protein